MILTCPECSTRYKTKKSVIGVNGRTLRCKQCHATWFEAAQEDKLSTPDDLQLADMEAEQVAQHVESELEPLSEDTLSGSQAESAPIFQSTGKSADVIMRDKVEAAKRRARLRTITLIWAIPLTLIGLIALALFAGRDQIIERYPEVAPLYNAVGIKTSVTGLEIDPPIIRIARVNGQQTIIINGVIRNLARETKDLPYLVLSLHAAGGDELAIWRVEFDRAELKSGESLEFASEYPNPPVDVKRLKYRLGDDAIGFNAPVSPVTPDPLETMEDELASPGLEPL